MSGWQGGYAVVTLLISTGTLPAQREGTALNLEYTEYRRSFHWYPRA